MQIYFSRLHSPISAGRGQSLVLRVSPKSGELESRKNLWYYGGVPTRSQSVVAFVSILDKDFKDVFGVQACGLDFAPLDALVPGGVI